MDKTLYNERLFNFEIKHAICFLKSDTQHQFQFRIAFCCSLFNNYVHTQLKITNIANFLKICITEKFISFKEIYQDYNFVLTIFSL